MYAPSFLFQSRHGIWYFRYIFSRPWRQRLGQTEIRRSLATRDRTQAMQPNLTVYLPNSGQNV